MGARKHYLVFFAAAFIVSAAAPRPAAACSCAGSRPACQAFWDPGAVFTGKVMAIETHSSGGAPFIERRVRFEVVEAFTGVTGSTIDVYTGNGGGDCGYAFVVGGTYLVYAYQATGSPWLTTGICSRTRPLSRATDDLAYLRSLSVTGPLGATLTGSVHHRDRNIAHTPGVTKLAPVASLGLVMECEGAAYRTTTDEDGRFTLVGVPVGSCTPRLESPGSDFLVIVRSIDIPDPRACAEVDLMVGTRRKD
jgi:hypothetical protein